MEDAFPLGLERDEQLADADVLVVANVTGDLSEHEIERIYEHVLSGMRLLVISSSMADGKAAASLLKRVFMHPEAMPADALDVHMANQLPAGLAGSRRAHLAILDAAKLYLKVGNSWGPGPDAPWKGATVLGVSGGTPLWVVGGTVPVLSSAPYGEGRVFCCTLGAQMTIDVLGGSSASILKEDPQAAQYRSLTALFDIVRGTAAPGSVHSRQAPAASHLADIEPAPLDVLVETEPALAGDGVPDGSPLDGNQSTVSFAGPMGDDPTPEQVVAVIERARKTFSGSVAADMFVFLKDATTVSFLSGYVVENGERSVVRLLGSSGTGALGEHVAPVTINLEAGAYQWSSAGQGSFFEVDREEPSIKRLPVRLPYIADAGLWDCRLVDSRPEALLETALRGEGFAGVSGQLWEHEAAGLYGDDREWESTPASGRHIVLSESEPKELTPFHLGYQELWLDSETMRITKLVLVYKQRGDVNINCWKQLVCVFFNERHSAADVLASEGTQVQNVKRLHANQAAFILEGSGK